MPILRIVQKGFETFTGMMGDVEFKDGVSTDHVSRADARRLASLFSCVDEETGANPSITQEMVDQRGFTLEQMQKADAERFNKSAKTAQPKKEEKPAEKKVDKPHPDFDFTAESLAEIADQEGLAGIRELAERFDVRGASIKAIIDALMAKKATAEAEAKAKK